MFSKHNFIFLEGRNSLKKHTQILGSPMLAANSQLYRAIVAYLDITANSVNKDKWLGFGGSCFQLVRNL